MQTVQCKHVLGYLWVQHVLGYLWVPVGTLGYLGVLNAHEQCIFWVLNAHEQCICVLLMFYDVLRCFTMFYDVLSTITSQYSCLFVFRMVALRRMFDADADNNFIAQVVELAVLDEQNYNDADIMVSVGKQLNWYVKSLLYMLVVLVV